MPIEGDIIHTGFCRERKYFSLAAFHRLYYGRLSRPVALFMMGVTCAILKWVR